MSLLIAIQIGALYNYQPIAAAVVREMSDAEATPAGPSGLAAAVPVNMELIETLSDLSQPTMLLVVGLVLLGIAAGVRTTFASR